MCDIICVINVRAIVCIILHAMWYHNKNIQFLNYKHKWWVSRQDGVDDVWKQTCMHAFMLRGGIVCEWLPWSFSLPIIHSISTNSTKRGKQKVINFPWNIFDTWMKHNIIPIACIFKRPTMLVNVKVKWSL